MLKYLAVLFLLIPATAHALTFEEGADAPTRTIEDYIKDYVDIPEGATDWKVFGKTKEINITGRDKDGMDFQYYKPGFTPEVKALNGKEITIKGFMFPLNSTDKQSLYLIGPFPVNCPYQYHVGSSLVIEVHADKNPVKFTYDPITIKGTLELVSVDKDFSVFYRLNDAKQVK